MACFPNSFLLIECHLFCPTVQEKTDQAIAVELSKHQEEAREVKDFQQLQVQILNVKSHTGLQIRGVQVYFTPNFQRSTPNILEKGVLVLPGTKTTLSTKQLGSDF